MMRAYRVQLLALAMVLATAAFEIPVSAQVGTGLIDPNSASEAQLSGLPHMTPARVTAILANRPFANSIALNTFLKAQGLTDAQTAEFYGKAFVHVNLNTATPEEILLIPGAGKRMVREFDEYRPWRNWAQFDKEISKYVGMPETNRLKQYVFIPLNLNTATDADFLTIPGVGPKMVHEFKEYRPWKTQAQFEKEIGKYVDAKEVARLWRFMTIVP
jgi:DNA uptake protein ComE-like DNA-binding protein